MAMNRVQFQPGLSMPEFLQRYGTEEQCAGALQVARWPHGFVCPSAGARPAPASSVVGCATGSARPVATNAVCSAAPSLPAPSCR